MSARAMTWRSTVRAPLDSKAVLMVLCDHANDKGMATVTIQTLARETGACRRTVIDAKHDLVQCGPITVTHRADADGGLIADLYCLLIEQPEQA